LASYGEYRPMFDVLLWFALQQQFTYRHHCGLVVHEGPRSGLSPQPPLPCSECTRSSLSILYWPVRAHHPFVHTDTKQNGAFSVLGPPSGTVARWRCACSPESTLCLWLFSFSPQSYPFQLRWKRESFWVVALKGVILKSSQWMNKWMSEWRQKDRSIINIKIFSCV